MGKEGASLWVSCLKAALAKPAPSEAAKPTIFRIPASFRGTSPDHFEVRTLNIGLHDREAFSAGAEEFKVAVAQALLQGEVQSAEEAWSKLVSKVVSNPQDARKLYERPSGDADAGLLDVSSLQDEAVAHILTLDAIFVVAFLMVSAGRCKIPSWEVTFRAPGLWALLNQMETELAIVPNQVPLSCLKEAVRVILESVEPRPTEDQVTEELEVLLRHVVLLLYPLAHDNTLLGYMESRYTGNNSLVKCRHILDCLYCVLSETVSQEDEAVGVAPVEEIHQTSLTVAEEPSETRRTRGRGFKSLFKASKTSKTSGFQFLGNNPPPTDVEDHGLMASYHPVLSAQKLHKSGIEIRSKPCRLSDISFMSRRYSNSLLLLPQLQLYDSSASELRNLAAYEFLAYPWNGQVRKYLRFMNDLISTPADAELVVRSGAIANYVGGIDEMVSIWSGLNRCIPLPVSDPDGTLERVEKGIHWYNRQVTGRWLANIKGTLVGKATVVFAATFALILMALIAAQTYAAFAYA